MDDHGVPITEVPAGSFMMGSPSRYSRRDESPPHQVMLDAFWIDVYEVTNARYAECVYAGACTEPHIKWGALPRFNSVRLADYPVVNIDWDQADTYCRWRGGRLPTEAEWEYAARGPKANGYPWGNQQPREDVHYHWGSPRPVGTYPSGRSWVGAYDMAGNVWEWTQDWYAGYPGTTDQTAEYGETHKVIRGGGYNTDRGYLRAASRQPESPSSFGGANYPDNLGFRCVRSTPGD